VTIDFMRVDLVTSWPCEYWPHGNWPGGNWSHDTESNYVCTVMKIKLQEDQRL